MLARIAGGAALLLAVMALIMVHQSWRNAPAASQPHRIAASAPTRSPEAPQANPPAAEAPDARIDVFIQHTASDESAARANELAHFLEDRGFAVADVRAVEFRVDRPSVRFYYERDRAGSKKLVEAIRAFFADSPEQAPDHTIDLTHSPQKPDKDEVEVWMAAS